MKNIIFLVLISMVVWFGCETNPVNVQSVDGTATLPGNVNFQVVPNFLYTAVDKQSTFRLVKTVNNQMEEVVQADVAGTDIADFYYDTQIGRWKLVGVKVGEGEVAFTDNDGHKAIAKVKVDSILITNQRPIALAYPEFPNGNIAPATVILKGSRSYDPEGEPLTYSWEMSDGTNLGNTADVTLSNMAAGNYVAILIVADQKGAQDVFVVNFTVKSPDIPINFPPTAIGYAGFPSGNIAPAIADLIGDQSYDPEGSALTYTWKKLDNSVISHQANTSVSGLGAGVHYYKLYVNDGQDDGMMIVPAVVVAPDDTTDYAPIALAYPEFPNGNVAPADVNLIGSNSYDPEGEPLTYSWEMSDGTNLGNTADVTLTGLAEGNYSAILTVTDPQGHQDVFVVSFVVLSKTNQRPIALAYPEFPNGNIAPATVILKGSRSYDPEGEPLTYSWEMSDGTNLGNTADVTLSNMAAGNYVAILIVADQKGAQDVFVVNFTVKSPDIPINFPPTAIGYAGFPSGNIAPAIADLIGDQSYDPEGSALTYTWKKLDNSVISHQANTSVSGLGAGVHYYKLYVNDGQDDGMMIVPAVVVAPDDTTDYAPIALAYPEFPNGNVAPADVNLIGSNSYDPEGEPLTYSWEMSDGTNLGNTADVTLTGLAEGNYSAILTVTDPQGHQDVFVVSFQIDKRRYFSYIRVHSQPDSVWVIANGRLLGETEQNVLLGEVELDSETETVLTTGRKNGYYDYSSAVELTAGDTVDVYLNLDLIVTTPTVNVGMVVDIYDAVPNISGSNNINCPPHTTEYEVNVRASGAYSAVLQVVSRYGTEIYYHSFSGGVNEVWYSGPYSYNDKPVLFYLTVEDDNGNKAYAVSVAKANVIISFNP